jgi:hypothetical protein
LTLDAGPPAQLVVGESLAFLASKKLRTSVFKKRRPSAGRLIKEQRESESETSFELNQARGSIAAQE